MTQSCRFLTEDWKPIQIYVFGILFVVIRLPQHTETLWQLCKRQQLSSEFLFNKKNMFLFFFLLHYITRNQNNIKIITFWTNKLKYSRITWNSSWKCKIINKLFNSEFAKLYSACAYEFLTTIINILTIYTHMYNSCTEPHLDQEHNAGRLRLLFTLIVLNIRFRYISSEMQSTITFFILRKYEYNFVRFVSTSSANTWRLRV